MKTRFLFLLLVISVVGCSQKKGQVNDTFLGGIALSPSLSTLVIGSSSSSSSMSSTVISGSTLTLSLTTKDQNGQIFISPTPLDISFSTVGGSSDGSFSPVIDHHDGTYTTVFTASNVGTQSEFRVVINGSVLSGPAPVVTVIEEYPSSFTVSAAATANWTGRVSVSWTASTGATSYTLKYGTSSGTYGTTVYAATSPTLLTGLIPGTTYYFMVTAVNSTGSTNAAAEVSAVPTAVSTVAISTPSSVGSTLCSGAISLTSKESGAQPF
jgi:hypothetical protein